MAIYTQADIDSVKQAVVALAGGTRVVTVSVGDRSVSYHAADLGKLQALLSEMSADVGSATKGGRIIGLRTSKGL